MAMTPHQRGVIAGYASAYARDTRLFARQGQQGLRNKFRAQAIVDWPGLNPAELEVKVGYKMKEHMARLRTARKSNKQRPSRCND
jgi:hypothetical protein